MESLKFISASDVKKVLTYELLIPKMEEALVKFSDNKVVQPVRSILPVSEHSGGLDFREDYRKVGILQSLLDCPVLTLTATSTKDIKKDICDVLGLSEPSIVSVLPNRFFGLMPSLCVEDNVLAVKLVSFYPQNKDVPTHNAVIAMFNAKNGVPEFIVDGEVITAMRTAAASAVATKHLCNKEPKILAIIGTGVQARSHFHALSALYTLKEIRVWGRTELNAELLAQDINGSVCRTIEDGVKEADIIVTVTSSTTPILKRSWVKPGAHINAVGACRPDWQEIDPELMLSASVFVDSKEAALKESGDVILSKAKIQAEIGEVVSGKHSGRTHSTEITLFKSLGLAIEDALSAKLVCDLWNRN